MHTDRTDHTIPAQPDTTPDLTALTATVRALLAAGWRGDYAYEVTDGTAYGLIHPSGREISATVHRHELVTLALHGLTLDQAVGAVTGAGLAPERPYVEPHRVGDTRFHIGNDGPVYMDAPAADVEPAPAPVDVDRDHRDRLAAQLHRIADDIANRRLPVGDMTHLALGVLDNRADLEQLASYLGSDIDEDGGTDRRIPKTEHTILFSDKRWGPSLTVRAQIRSDGRSEVERLRAEPAELRAAQGGTR